MQHKLLKIQRKEHAYFCDTSSQRRAANLIPFANSRLSLPHGCRLTARGVVAILQCDPRRKLRRWRHLYDWTQVINSHFGQLWLPCW